MADVTKVVEPTTGVVTYTIVGPPTLIIEVDPNAVSAKRAARYLPYVESARPDATVDDIVGYLDSQWNPA